MAPINDYSALNVKLMSVMELAKNTSMDTVFFDFDSQQIKGALE